MSDPAIFSGSGAVREAHRFDEDRLETWLTVNVDGFAGPLTVEQFKGGQSNPTYKLITPGRTYVLRRKPPGQLLKGAHAIEREARIMHALGNAGFPVPRIHGLCTDDAVIGTWFFVMDMVEGRIFWDPALPDIAKDERAVYFAAMNATIAQLHSIDPVAAGLEDYGRSENFVQRQIARWSKQYHDDVEGGRDPNLDRLVEWLPEHLPAAQGSAIFHGDFRLDNMIFHPNEPKVLAVLDWELSTLGDPLADFAYHLMMYRLPPLTIPFLGGIDLAAAGLPDQASYVAAYCRMTGRDGIADLDFYLAFVMFRFAAICHGVKARMVRGTASNPNAASIAADIPTIAEIAWQQAMKVSA